MKIKEQFKKLYANKNLFIAVCVGILTISVIGVSYSAFFTVQSDTVNQEVTTGTLSVSYSGDYVDSNNKYDTYDLLPMSDEEALISGSSRIIHIENKGTLPSEFTLTIGYDLESFQDKDGELTPIDYVRFAVYSLDTTTGESELVVQPKSITELPIYTLNEADSRQNRYTVLVDTIGVKDNTSIKNYQVKIWLSDQATPTVSHTYFYFNSEVVAAVAGAKQSYDLSGILKDATDSPIADATIDIQNGSKLVKTTSTGAFNISKLPSGTYNIEIKTEDETRTGNLTIEEENSLEVKSMGTSFTATDNKTIYDYANDYHTTVNKIITKNNLEGITSNINLINGTSYNLDSTYLINSNTTQITNLNINLTTDGFTITQ